MMEMLQNTESLAISGPPQSGNRPSTLSVMCLVLSTVSWIWVGGKHDKTMQNGSETPEATQYLQKTIHRVQGRQLQTKALL